MLVPGHGVVRGVLGRTRTATASREAWRGTHERNRRMKTRMTIGAVMMVAGLATAWQPGTGTAVTGSGGAVTTEQPPAPPVPPARQPSTFAWTDKELEKIGSMLAGSWQTTKPVPVSGGAPGETVNIVMQVAPVVVEGMPNTLYVETARADSIHAPFRQALFQLYTSKGKVRMRTLEFHRGADAQTPHMPALVGMAAIPQWFPKLTSSSVYGTLDLEVTAEGAGFKGKSPHPFPTSLGGAVEMTSEITLTKDTLTTIDRGFDADGKVVWGSSEGEQYQFARVPSPITVKDLGEGLLVLELKKGAEGKAIEERDRVSVQYTGWVGGDAKQFDSSRGRPQPFTFNQGQLIRGWNTGLIGYQKGSVVRLLIPPALAYGDRARGPIPANSDLYFEVEVLNVEAAPPAPTAGPEAPEQPQPTKAIPDSTSGK